MSRCPLIIRLPVAGRTVFFAAIFIGLAASPTDAGDRGGWFVFNIPTLATDPTEGTAIDLSHLNEARAGDGGFLRADGERIVGDDGEEVRLFGTNICDWQTMPDPEVARPIARRLAELGVNFVRLCYFDYTSAPWGMMTEDMRTLDAERLDRFDRLCHELIEAGIYLDINLHVARKYPSLPDWWEWRGKGIDRIHAGLIEEQQSYARQLLTHVNPYTGRSYVDDPGVAAVEISNEDSAMLPWPSLNRTLYADLPDEFRVPVRRLWNDWLVDKYGDIEGLREAWADADPVDPGERIRDGSFGEGLAEWDRTSMNAGESEWRVVDGDDHGPRRLRWDVTRAGGEDWSHQINQASLPVEDGRSYVIRFRGRATRDDGDVTPLKISVMQQQEPWETVLGPVAVDLTDDWQTVEVSGSVANPAGVPVRLNLDANNQVATFELTDISLVEGSLDPLAVADGRDDVIDPAVGNVPLPKDRTTAAMLADYDQFIIDRDLAFARTMADFLRDDLGAKCLIWDTQANYDGTMGLLRESMHSDVVDMHEYPDHPRGQQNADGKFIWHVQHRSLLREAFGKFETLNHYRVRGKPFFVSEFDLSPPGDHAHEAITVVPILASLQGWSGLAEYAWLNFQQDVDPDRIVGAYNTAGHTGQVAMFPTAALLYRTGMVRPLTARQTLVVHADTLRHGPPGFTAMDLLFEEVDSDPIDAWSRRTTVDIREGSGETRMERTGDVAADLDQTIRLHPSDGPPFDHLSVVTPRFRCVVGRCGGGTYDLGDTTVTVAGGTKRNYAGVYLVALDDRPIGQSRRVLLTTMARVENADWQWNEDHTTIGPDFGRGPVVVEPVAIDVDLPDGPAWTVTRLTPEGRPGGNVLDIGPDGTFTTADNPGVWFLIER